MSYSGWILCLICLLAGGTLFFSLNAAALQTFSRLKLEAVSKTKGREKLADSIIKNTEKLVLTCSLYRLIFNMCILLLLLAYLKITSSRSPTIGDYTIIFLIAAAIFSIFNLIIPHTWAKFGSEKILLRTYKLLILCMVPAWPFLYAFRLTDSLVRRLLGAPPATPKELQQEREEQFLTSLELQKMQGLVDEQEKEMIENVLQLSSTVVSEIMTPRLDMVAIEATSDLKTILDAITSTGHSRVPVYEGTYDNVIGFIYAKDLLTALDKDPSSFNLRERLREVYFVPETKLLRDLLHEFQSQKLHIAIVIDEYGGTAGLVSIEDILEELVGEITDEYEKISPKPIKQVDANTLETDAKTPINSINDQFELNLPASEDYDTISGFILSHLGYVPKTGESFDYKNLKFTVLSAEARRIKRIKIQKTTV